MGITHRFNKDGTRSRTSSRIVGSHRVTKTKSHNSKTGKRKTVNTRSRVHR